MTSGPRVTVALLDMPSGTFGLAVARVTFGQGALSIANFLLRQDPDGPDVEPPAGVVVHNPRLRAAVREAEVSAWDQRAGGKLLQ